MCSSLVAKLNKSPMTDSPFFSMSFCEAQVLFFSYVDGKEGEDELRQIMNSVMNLSCVNGRR